jgi:DNA-binding transcriptional ArsR family regulator
MTRSAQLGDSATDQPLMPRILAALAQPRHLSELSDALEVTDSRLKWHLDALEKSGHVRRGAEGRWGRTPSGTSLMTRLVVVADGPFSSSVYDLDQAYAEARAGLYGSAYVQRAGHHASRLSAAQAAEFANRLEALIAEYFAPGQRDPSGAKYGLSWAVTPVDLHPLGDD